MITFALLFHEIPDAAVCFLERFYFSEAQAVFRVHVHHAGSAFRHFRAGKVADLKFDDVFHTGGFGVFARIHDGYVAQVCGNDAQARHFPDLFFQQAPFFEVHGFIEALQMHKGVVVAEQAGAAVGGYQRGFYGYCAGAAHGIDEGRLPVPPGSQDGGGGQGLQHGGAARYFAVAVPRQRIAGGVYKYFRVVIFPEEMDNGAAQLRAGRGAFPRFFPQAVHHRVFHAQVGEHSVVDRIILHIAGDREITVFRQYAFPGKAV